MRRVRVTIMGQVQGVFFRRHVKEHANMLDISGYVYNKEDGSVEAVFEGDDSDIEEMLEFCKEGPRGAKVDDVEIEEEEYKNEYDEFEVRV